jgi:signal transduction histidine kinase
MGENLMAKKYALEAVEVSSNQPTPKYEIAAYYINTGDIFYREKDFIKSLHYLHYGYQLSREIQHRENSRDAAEYLSQTYASLNQNDSAFYFYRIFTGLKDSIVNNETKMKIAGIQGQYDIAKKDKEITRQQQIRNILIASFIFLLIVLLLIYNGYRLKQKNKYQQAINRQQNELFNAIVSTQDQERKRIAQDIHDGLGSVLSAAKLKLSSLEESKMILSAGQLENYHDSLVLLDEASTELRNISHDIMPATLSKLGLEAALKNLIGKIAAHSCMQINFTAHGFDERIEENTEMSIYRIILELINNIVKHAAAQKVTLQLIKYPTYINLVIEDNGVGFNYEKIMEEKKGIGMGNIFSRVEYLKGTIEIDSLPGKGTTVIIDIPYLAGNK